jgi:hypothetical protein
MRRRATGCTRGLLAVALSAALIGCVPDGDSIKPPRPFYLRAYCAVRSWVNRDEFRVPQDQVDPCAVEPPSLDDLLPQKREPSKS